MKWPQLRTDSLCPLYTFVPGGLGPQNSGDVGGPGLFDIQRGGLKDEGLILGRPPSEPDLKPQPVVSCGLCQTHISCLKDKEELSLSLKFDSGL